MPRFALDDDFDDDLDEDGEDNDLEDDDEDDDDEDEEVETWQVRQPRCVALKFSLHLTSRAELPRLSAISQEGFGQCQPAPLHGF
jgi:hypothetical protein